MSVNNVIDDVFFDFSRDRYLRALELGDPFSVSILFSMSISTLIVNHPKVISMLRVVSKAR